MHHVLALLAAGTVTLGVCAGVLFEGWHPMTAIYVLVQITTTVGYGDVTVASDWMKGFMTVYVLLTMVVVAYLYQVLSQKLVERSAERLLQVTSGRLGRRLHPTSKLLGAAVVFGTAIVTGAAFYRLWEHCTCGAGATYVPGCKETDFETCVGTGGFSITWTSAFYMSVITLTTVGFGDHVPHTEAGRAFACCWMLAGVASAAHFLGSVAEFFFHLETEEKLAKGKEQEVDSLAQRLGRKRGGVSRAAFRGLALVRQGLVPPEVLAEIDREFDALDSDGEEMLGFEAAAEPQVQRLPSSWDKSA